MIKYVKGDLIQLAKEGHFTVIGHGCNCFNAMGAGIAKQIKQHFPKAEFEDLITDRGDQKKLGGYTGAFINYPDKMISFWVLNLYTQYSVGYGSADYDAIRKCMAKIKQDFGIHHKIGLPKIGAGLAGGDWKIIEKIIEEELDGCDVTVVEYEKN